MNVLLRSNLRHYWRRYVATGVAVLISVMFVVMVLVLRDGVSDSMAREFTGRYAGSAAVVTTEDSGDPLPVSEALEKLRSLPQVESVGVQASDYVRFGEAGEGPVSIQLAPPFASSSLAEGEVPAQPGEIALTQSQATDLGKGVGDTVSISSYDSDVTHDFTVTGVFDGTVAVFATGAPTASSVTYESFVSLQPDPEALYVEGYLLAAAPGVTDEQVSQAAGQTLKGTDLHATTTSAMVEQQLKEQRLSIAQLMAAFMVFPAIAAVMALVVISTTFQVLLRQRRQEIGLLRCVGATSAQVRGLLVQEALLVGAVASAIGAVLGILLATPALTALGLVPSFGAAYGTITWLPVFLAFLGGTLATLVAGSRPAFVAANLPPLVTLADSQAEETRRTLGWSIRLILGALIAVGATSVMIFAAFSKTSGGLLTALVMGPLALIGIAIAMASFFPIIQGVLSRVWPGPLAKIAGANARRTPGRTAATGVSMLIGVTLVSTMIVGAASARHTLATELDSRIATDLIVSGTNLTEDDAAKIAEIPGVSVAAAESSTSSVAEASAGDPAEVGTPADSAGENSPVEIDGTPFAVYDTTALQESARTDFGKLEQDQVLLPPYLGYQDGQTVPVCSLGTCTDFRAVNNSSWIGDSDAAGVNPEAFAELSAGHVIHTSRVLVQLDDLSNFDKVSQELTRLDKGWELSGAAPVRAGFDRAINVLLAALVALLAVSVLVALIGVSNALSLSVVERTRELGLLRALGMTRRQVQSLLRTEAVQTALTAGILGILLGMLFGWVGTVAVFMDLGEPRLAVPWLQLALVLVVTVVAAAIAAWLPGRRAAKTSPVEALVAA